jgi:hypothetical protein
MQFSGVLRKSIDLDDAPARGLKCTSLPPEEEDRLVYQLEQILARLDALDRHYNIAPNTPHIDFARAKALLSDIYKIDASNPKFWMELSMALALRHIPGFSHRRPDKKKHGAPREWTNERLTQLLADIEYCKKTTGKTVKDICQRLPRASGYASRWGNCTGQGLCRQYSRARRLNCGLLLQCDPSSKVNAAVSGPDVDTIDAVIEGHALKRQLCS